MTPRSTPTRRPGPGPRHSRRAAEPERRPAPRTEPGPRPELPYVGGFDGLRAVALLAVLAFHQGFEVARGGFLGISSFFTLSGFLLATLALAEWAQDGRLAVGRLWENRARRILPPVVFTVAVVVVLQVVLRVGAGPGYKGDVLASLGQVLNWRFAFSGDGFASVLTDPSPVQHLWPLSVLVQLTVIFPLAFVGLMRLPEAGGAPRASCSRCRGRRLVLPGAADGPGLRQRRARLLRHPHPGRRAAGRHRAGLRGAQPAVRRVIETRQGVAVIRYGAPAALVGLAWLWYSTEPLQHQPVRRGDGRERPAHRLRGAGRHRPRAGLHRCSAACRCARSGRSASRPTCCTGRSSCSSTASASTCPARCCSGCGWPPPWPRRRS